MNKCADGNSAQKWAAYEMELNIFHETKNPARK
jgi:hypothetical protein